MASRRTVTTENLVALGVERLAGLLLELAGKAPAIKRRLRLELAGEGGGEIIAAEIAKRLTTRAPLGRSSTGSGAPTSCATSTSRAR